MMFYNGVPAQESKEIQEGEISPAGFPHSSGHPLLAGGLTATWAPRAAGQSSGRAPVSLLPCAGAVCRVSTPPGTPHNSPRSFRFPKNFSFPSSAPTSRQRIL